MEAVRIIDEMKEATHGEYPKFALWENVPGALSSAGGRDFKAVLGALTKSEVPMPYSGRWANAGMVRSGGADIAWCVYDSQYFGTAQRRRRVFLVADLGGRRAGKVLFVPESLRGYFAAGGTPRQGASAFIEDGAGETGVRINAGEEGKGDDGVYCIIANSINHSHTTGSGGLGCAKELSYTLTAGDRHAVTAPSVTMRMRSGCKGGGKGPLCQTEKSATLQTANDQYLFSSESCREPAERPSVVCMGSAQASAAVLEEQSPTLTCARGGPPILRDSDPGYRVRRLTPLECERLQGFPDHWTRQGDDGRMVSDTKRYQMLGNSIAVPCVAYIMQGITDVLGRDGAL